MFSRCARNALCHHHSNALPELTNECCKIRRGRGMAHTHPWGQGRAPRRWNQNVFGKQHPKEWTLRGPKNMLVENMLLENWTRKVAKQARAKRAGPKGPGQMGQAKWAKSKGASRPGRGLTWQSYKAAMFSSAQSSRVYRVWLNVGVPVIA